MKVAPINSCTSAFDLLFLNGQNTAQLTLIERKGKLARLFKTERRPAILDYDVAPVPALPSVVGAGETQMMVGNIGAICQAGTQHAV